MAGGVAGIPQNSNTHSSVLTDLKKSYGCIQLIVEDTESSRGGRMEVIQKELHGYKGLLLGFALHRVSSVQAVCPKGP